MWYKVSRGLHIEHKTSYLRHNNKNPLRLSREHQHPLRKPAAIIYLSCEMLAVYLPNHQAGNKKNIYSLIYLHA